MRTQRISMQCFNRLAVAMLCVVVLFRSSSGNEANSVEPAAGGTVHFRPIPTTDFAVPVPERFRLTEHMFPYQRTALPNRWAGVEESIVTFASPIETPHAVNNTVHCEYFAPLHEGEQSERRQPGVVVLHILGGDFELSRFICRSLAANGMGALFVKMPYYGPRRQAGVAARMVSDDIPQSVQGLTQAVLDIRRAAAWLASQPEVAPDRLGITGISLGGIVSALTAANEPRFRRVLPVLAGGNFGIAAWGSTELEGTRERWQAQGLTAERIADMVRIVDPVTYAPNLRDRQVLMINARHDQVIPRQCAEALWEAAGKPEIVWWNANHYSSVWRLPEGVTRMVHFFGAE